MLTLLVLKLLLLLRQGGQKRRLRERNHCSTIPDFDGYCRHGIDPYTYLRDVLTRLRQMTNWQIPAVIPSVWGKAPLQLQRQIAS